MAEAAVWWIEVIKVSPGLIAAGLATGVVLRYRNEVSALLSRLTKFKGLGFEAEFGAKSLDQAIAAHQVAVSQDDKRGAIKRLNLTAPLLRDMNILWADDHPEGNKYERALLEGLGVRVHVVTTSKAAEDALRSSVFTLVITDLKREGNDLEGLAFVDRTWNERTYRWTIAYTGTDQTDQSTPAHLFGITNRPDHLMHLICDIAERERL
jgi:CheY-like chemotaxis protein